MSSPKFALIGNGFVAKRHVDAIKHVDGELVAIVDIDKEKRIDGIPLYTYYKFLSADKTWDDITHISICTPNYLHAEMSRWFLERGKTVLCEKPLGLSVSEIESLEKYEKLFTVLQLRHHPIMDEMKKYIESGVTDVSLHIKVKRPPTFWTGWQGNDLKSGGILFILGIHYFDALMNLFGDVVSVKKTTHLPNLVVGSVLLSKFDKEIPFTIAIDDTDVDQDRYIMIDGNKYRFSNKDNLSMEGLHDNVYRDLMNGTGVKPLDLVGVTKLIELIKYSDV